MKPVVSTESVLLAPVTAATTQRTANLDIADSNYVEIRLVVSAEANTNSTNVAVRLLESDTTAATSFVTFNSTYNFTLDNTAAAVAPLFVDSEGRRRYLRLEVTPDTTTNGAVISSALASVHRTVVSSTVTDLGANVKVG